MPFCFCNAQFLIKQCFKGLHYSVEILLTGKGKVDTFPIQRLCPKKKYPDLVDPSDKNIA